MSNKNFVTPPVIDRNGQWLELIGYTFESGICAAAIILSCNEGPTT